MPGESRIGQVQAVFEELRGLKAVPGGRSAVRLERREPRDPISEVARVGGGADVVAASRIAAVDAVRDRCRPQRPDGVDEGSGYVPAENIDRADGSALRERGDDEQVAVAVVPHERLRALGAGAADLVLQEPEGHVRVTIV